MRGLERFIKVSDNVQQIHCISEKASGDELEEWIVTQNLISGNRNRIRVS